MSPDAIAPPCIPFHVAAVRLRADESISVILHFISTLPLDATVTMKGNDEPLRARGF